MGQIITLDAADGHALSAWEAGFADSPRALVVLQEIFGVNHHIRAVCDGFADAGYHVVAPALFDRAERGVELGYAPQDGQRGMQLRSAIAPDATLADILAAAGYLGRESVGVIGYCWGGALAWAAATQSTRFKAAIGWYGGGIAATRTAHPNCPVQLHFGALDDHIPLSDVEAIRAAQPGIELFIYDDAGHGFGCSERPSYEARATALAQERSLAFLQHHL
ncbi:dienelactone hydrolase family protein [Lichenicoccus sp.]|uniref:dienelactone hydrolase family protein n=1 Tax=Lichenicoccus sp. TaxID=2781899 RepID=UPI003D098CDC